MERRNAQQYEVGGRVVARAVGLLVNTPFLEPEENRDDVDVVAVDIFPVF